MAYVELAALCDLDTLLLYHQKAEDVSGYGKLPISPAFSLFSKPADGCNELTWPPDVSIALPKKPESYPRTSGPAWTPSKFLLDLLLDHLQALTAGHRQPTHFSALLTDRLAGASAVP